MAGGSADAAGVIVGIDALCGLNLSRDEMENLAAELGSDVPFSIAGGIAVGRGRGDQITPALARGTYHWVVAMAGSGLSTPAVYKECDRLREGLDIARPQTSDQLLQALRALMRAQLENSLLTICKQLHVHCVLHCDSFLMSAKNMERSEELFPAPDPLLFSSLKMKRELLT